MDTEHLGNNTEIQTDEDRRKFIHDIRTSLAVIKTGSEVALFETDISPEIQRVLEHNIQEVDRASKILDTIRA